jgi:hypothetical protein
MPLLVNGSPVEKGSQPMVHSRTEARAWHPTHACPNCGGNETWPSRRRSLRDIAAALLLTSPYRCRHCLRRFYVFLPNVGM